MIQIPFMVYAAIMAAAQGANMMAAKKVDDERAKAIAEERKKRIGLAKENEASAEKSKQVFANTRADQDARAAEMTSQIAATPTSVTTDAGGSRLLDPTSPPSATSTVEQARDMFAQGDAQSAARAAAKAQAGSFGSVFQDYGTNVARNAQDMDMNATTMRNWNQRVLPARLEYANQAGRQWGTAADVLKLAASVMGPYALGNGGGGAGAGTVDAEVREGLGLPPIMQQERQPWDERLPEGMGDPYSGWLRKRKGFPWNIIPTTPVDPRPFGGIIYNNTR